MPAVPKRGQSLNPRHPWPLPNARIPLLTEGYPGSPAGLHTLARRMPLLSDMKTTDSRLGTKKGSGDAGRVLIVEDDPGMCQTIQRTLLSNGYRAESVVDGEQAMARLQREDFVAVVADVGLTRMHGVDLLREIRRMDGFLPAVMYMGVSDPAAASQFRQNGGFGVLMKGGPTRDLLWSVEEACRAVFRRPGVRCA
jgi:CheY-like chemotaxis protein